MATTTIEAGAAIGTLISSGVGTAVGTTLGAIASIFPAIKGKTPHISFADASKITNAIADSIVKIIVEGSPGMASLGSDVNNGTFSNAAANAIDASTWWKVGNNQLPNISKDIRSDHNGGGTIWRVLMWAFMNAPSDNFRDTYFAVKEIFDRSLYLITNKSNAKIAQAIDITLASACGQTAASANIQALAKNGKNIFSVLAETVDSIFGGKGTAAASDETKKAGLSTVAIIVIGGMVLFVIYNLIKKGKPF